jgi:hypothetical protein
MKNSFDVRFMKPGFVSHFLPIPAKGETKNHLRTLSPMKSPAKTPKRSLLKAKALISSQTVSFHPVLHFVSWGFANSKATWIFLRPLRDKFSVSTSAR